MEGLLMTVGLLVVMVGALVVLARTWPRSSQRTGYRLGDPREPTSPPPRQEEDEVHFRFPESPGGPRNPEG